MMPGHESSACLVPIYRALAAAFLAPEGGARAAVAEEAEGAREAARAIDGSGPLERGIERLGRAFAAVTDGELRDEHARVFGHVISAGCPPYETQWGGAQTFQQAQQLADVGGFYRAWGLKEGGCGERLDHVATELEFEAFLAWKEVGAAAAEEGEHADVAREARRRFFEEHLGRWAPLFAKRLARRAGYGPYLAAARALGALLAADAAALGLAEEGERECSPG